MNWIAPVYRKSYKKKYGSRCFLKPKGEKYPVCKNGKISCKALRAAAYYGRLLHNKNVTKKAKKLIKKCI
jgi:hypothetical protein